MSPLRSFLVGCLIGLGLIACGALYIFLRAPRQEEEAQRRLERLHRSVRGTIASLSPGPAAPPRDAREAPERFLAVEEKLLARYPRLVQRLSDPKSIYGFGEKIAERIDLMEEAMNTLTRLLAEAGLSIGEHATTLQRLLETPSPIEQGGDRLELARFYCSYYKVAEVVLPRNHFCRSFGEPSTPRAS